MIADLKQYVEYKESGVPWLGRVPGHWDVLPLGALARLKSIVNQSKRQLLSVYLQRGVVRFSDVAEKRTNATSTDLSKYQAVDPGDFVLNNQQAWRGSVGVSEYSGIVSPAYLVLALAKQYSAPYANLLFRDQSMVSQYLVCSKGVGTIQRNLFWPHLKRVGVVVPPPDEQAAIVRFLDWANGRLERAIRAKRKVIALLNEQKQAIIHRAVTRGLDPNVPLKPSGIPWLGDIPDTCNRTKLSRVCISVRDGTHNPPPAVAGIHRLLSVRNIIHGEFVIRDDDRTMTPSAFAELQRSYTVQRGDVVVAIVGATTGKCAVVGAMESVTVQRSLAILRPTPKLVRSDYLNLLVSSEIIQGQLKQIITKYAAQPGIYLNELSSLQVIYPSLQDQDLIVAHVNAVSEPLKSAIERLSHEIELLREYRTRLVADVVTGKLDVRDAAARLPDEAMFESAVDDTELADETEAADEEVEA